MNSQKPADQHQIMSISILFLDVQQSIPYSSYVEQKFRWKIKIIKDTHMKVGPNDEWKCLSSYDVIIRNNLSNVSKLQSICRKWIKNFFSSNYWNKLKRVRTLQNRKKHGFITKNSIFLSFFWKSDLTT